ncbi:hypothetical protein [Rubritalea squalenifaciens]|uniref:hypothetical protein n=1 Tax=Rubritalea squalenifaciens TaxID=407226 RepID=UPI0013564EE0|nr:hypothetical protein [Rubritalea squalenifaciens]
MNPRCFALGSSLAVAQLQSGDIVAWGDSAVNFNAPPTPPLLSKLIVDDTSTVALSENGQILEWDYLGNPSATIPTFTNSVTDFSAASGYRLALLSDKTVVGWKADTGELLDLPVNLTNICQVLTTGIDHFFLHEDGTLTHLATNTGSSAVSDPPSDLSDIEAISISNGLALAIKNDGSVVAWGGKYIEELNDLTNVAHATTYGSTAFIQFNDGSYSFYGFGVPPVILNRSLWACNAGSHNASIQYGGKLRSNLTALADQHTIPTNIPSPKAVAASRYATHVINADGTLSSFGSYYGGDNSLPPNISDAIKLKAKWDNVIAVRENGELALWPQNRFIRTLPADLKPCKDVALGGYRGYAIHTDGTLTHIGWLSSGDRPPAGLTDVKKVACTWYEQIAIKNDNTVVTWGNAGTSSSTTAVLPDGLGECIDAVGTGFLFFAIRSDNTLVRWYASGTTRTLTTFAGTQNFVEVDACTGADLAIARRLDGTVVSIIGDTLIEHPEITNAVQVAAGGEHVTVVEEDGTTHTWGGLFDPINAAPENSVHSAAISRKHGLAIGEDQSLSAWGRDNYDIATIPNDVDGAISVAVGDDVSLVVKPDQTLRVWGDPANPIVSNIPESIGPVTSVSSSSSHAAALLTDKSVIAWGENSSGQNDVPLDLPPIKEIACGASHTLALSEDGFVYAWGNNTYGQSDIPSGLTNVISIAAGQYHSVALKGDGSIITWGDTRNGQHHLHQMSIPVTSIASNAFSNSTFYQFGPSGQQTYDNLTTDMLAAGLSGDDLEITSVPFVDGISNLLKWSSNMDLSSYANHTLEPNAGTSGLPHFSTVETEAGMVFRLEFLRRKNSSLIYNPEFSSNLQSYQAMTGTTMVDSIDGTWEKVTIEKAIDPNGSGTGFGRVRITLP